MDMDAFAYNIPVKLLIQRQFLYSLISFLFSPLLFVSLYYSELIPWIQEKEELPFDTVFYIVGAEVCKILFALWVYPSSDLFNSSIKTNIGTGLFVFGPIDGEPKNSSSSTTGTDKSHPHNKLPVFRKDSSLGTKIPATEGGTGSVRQLLEIVKSILSFVLSVGICHVFVILFGASFIEKWKITFQYSFILTSWFILPLWLLLRPSRILPELFFISIWDNDCFPLWIGKWRLLGILFGSWIGAIVVPLDWDRPWQIWPVPTLCSSSVAHVVVNGLISLYLGHMLYSPNITNYEFRKPKDK